MEINRAGIDFDVTYRPGSHGSWNEPPEPEEIEVTGWTVRDWDELAEMYGAKGETPMFRANLFALVDAIADRHYDSMVDDAGDEYRSDFKEPDEPDFDDYQSCF
jgi:hypothetical protein